MPVSPAFRDEIAGLLNQVAPVSHRALFGGVGFYYEGLIFGLIDGRTVYFKVDDANRADYEAEGMEAFMPYGPEKITMQYYRVPEAVLADKRRLGAWVEKAVAVAGRASKQKPARKRRPTRRS